MRLLFFLWVSAALFAQNSVEIITYITHHEKVIEVGKSSGGAFWLKRDGAHLVRTWKEKDILCVAGSGVVTLRHPGSDIVVLASTDSEVEPGEIDTVEIFGLRRSGTEYLMQLMRDNYPSVAISYTDALPSALQADMIANCTSLRQVKGKLLQTGLSPVVDTRRLVLIIVRDPYEWLKSLYAVARLPFKEDVSRGFNLFLAGQAKLPEYISERQRPFKEGGISHPLQLRSLWLVEALYMRNTAQAWVISYERLREDPAGVIAELSARFRLPYGSEVRSTQMDTSGRGIYTKQNEISLSKEQQLRIDELLDKELEALFKTQ